MKIILIPISLIVAVLLLYALWGREWLKKKPWADGFFAVVEPVEIFLFKKSETILFGRMLAVLGGLLTLLTQLGSIDITPLMPLVPTKYAGVVMVAWNLLPMLISALGVIVEKLRRSTTKPLELVSVPDKIVAENPVVAAKIAAADEMKQEAVSTVVAAEGVK